MRQKKQSRNFRINNIGDKLFYIENIKDDLESEFSFEWNCSEDKIALGQFLFLHSSAVKGYVDPLNRIVATSHSSAYQEWLHIKCLCEYWEKNLPHKALWDMTRYEVAQYLRINMKKETEGINDSSIYASTEFSFHCKIIQQTHELFLAGKISDGIRFPLTYQFRREIMEPLLVGVGMRFEEWRKGSSYGSIPLSVASIMLSTAIGLLESDQVKLARAVFKNWRRHPSHPRHLFHAGKTNRDILQQYHYVIAKDRTPNSKGADLVNEIKQLGLEIPHCLPWNSHGKLGDFCKQVAQAALTVMILLSGFRIQEISSIRPNWYKRVHGEWIFITTIEKTHLGTSAPRYIHGIAAFAANILCELSYTDIPSKEISIFHKGYAETATAFELQSSKYNQHWCDTASIDKETLRTWFSEFYENQVLSIFHELKNYFPNVKPHQARHTWAEFALRRFDGAVEEKIREHFAHTPGSNHTKRYTEGKLAQDVQSEIEQAYLIEIIERIRNQDLDDRFIGPAAIRILKEVDKITAITPQEFDRDLTNLANSIERIAAFEWGYCILFKNGKSAAKCFNDDAGLPDIDGGSSSRVCIYCPNNMNHISQNLTLTRIAIEHAYFAEHHKIKAIGKLSDDIAVQIKKRVSMHNENHDF